MIEGLQLGEAIEASRLTSLRNLGVLDTMPQPDFDAITRLAALACNAEGATITLIDAHRAWFKSRLGIEVAEVPREHALCSLEIDQVARLIIPDTWEDERCTGNPLTSGDDAVRFYAGVSLITGAGHCIGRLCVFDKRPRAELTAGQIGALNDLARLTIELMEARSSRQIGHIASHVVDVTSDAILCADATGTITFWNAAAETMFGRSARDVIGAKLDIIVPPSLRAAHSAGFAKAAEGGHMKLAGGSVELTAMRADASTFPIELSLGRWQDDAGVSAFAAIIRDASCRKQLEDEREQARAFLKTVIENLPAMLFVKNADTQRYLLMNKAGAEIAELRQADFVGRTDSELFPGVGEAYESRDRAACETPGTHVFESEHLRTDGQSRHLRTKRLMIEAAAGSPRYLLGMTEDVTEARQAQAEVQRLAAYDSLTGLRNRASYVRRADALVAAGTPFALLSIDLDRFKAVNDQFGHLAGDAVLVEVAARLSTLADPGDLLARIGGDEFVLVLTGESAAARITNVAQSIIQSMDVPITTDRVRAPIGASIGIALYPQDGSTSTEVRQASDLALYRAKRDVRGTACFYSEAMDAAARDRHLLEIDLRDAIERDEISLVFQPVIALNTGQVTSFEALARWNHATRGAVPPAEFICLAEECGLIEPLGLKLLSKACAEAAKWPVHVRVAVNLSPIQFQSGRLCASVDTILQKTGLDAGRLQLEVTEGLLIRDVDHTFEQLEQLRAQGIQILMDDFGVGYSSLSYFERFTFDKVKIDRSFVDSASVSPAAQAIIKAVVQLGTTLGMGIVAEGIETTDQQAMVAKFGCTHAQGYVISRPVEAEHISSLLQPN